MHQWSVLGECFKHTYAPTGACFYWRNARGDYSRKHKVRDGPELLGDFIPLLAEAQGSSAGPRAGALDPNLAPEGEDFQQECCCQQVCSLCQQTAPHTAHSRSCWDWRWASRGLQKPLCRSWVTFQACSPFGWGISRGRAAWGCSGSWDRDAGYSLIEVSVGLHFVVSGEASPGCSRCVDLSISSGFASWDSAAASGKTCAHMHPVWKQGGRQQGALPACLLPARSTAPVPQPPPSACQMAGAGCAAGGKGFIRLLEEFLRLFTPVCYFCNQLYFKWL